MKLTVILRSNGTLVGTAQHLEERTDVQSTVQSTVQATIRPMAGHTLHEIEVPDEYRGMAPQELHERIRSHHLRSHCR